MPPDVAIAELRSFNGERSVMTFDAIARFFNMTDKTISNYAAPGSWPRLKRCGRARAYVWDVEAFAREKQWM